MYSFLSIITKAFSQDIYIDNLVSILQELREATTKHTDLWDKELYGGLLFVDPKTRIVYANEPDKERCLQPTKGLYIGTLPTEINIANTAMKWGGKEWAMVMLPLPDKKEERITLLAHELFHRLQPQLHFINEERDNAHLDTQEGRIYLRLELEALKKALFAKTLKEQRKHLMHALAFRTYRYQLFPKAVEDENVMEKNEGLAEYTGLTVAGFQNNPSVGNYFKVRIENFEKNPTFVRSFAYTTIPIYGYFAFKEKKYWNKDITNETNLTDYFIKLFNITLPENFSKFLNKWVNIYNGVKITEQEKIREQQRQQLLTHYRAKLIDRPHLRITFQKMKLSFDPRNVIPLEGAGTVYPQIRITDVWGVLSVTGGALISSDWRTVTVEAPIEINGNRAQSKSWNLILEKGYTIVEQEGNYIVCPQ